MGEAKRRRKFRSSAFQSSDEELLALGINTDEFGFYDQEPFLAQEREDNTFLEKYAQWVVLRPLNEAYVSHVRAVVPKLAEIIAVEFVEQAMEGGCVAASGMISRMLDRLGVWSVAVAGSLTLDIEKHDIRRALHSVDVADFPGAALGHAWVIAPPYKIIDTTISLQHWSNDKIEKLVPRLVLADESAKVIRPSVRDVVSAEIRRQHEIYEGKADSQLHYRLEPRLKDFGAIFPATEVVLGDLKLHYVPVAVRQTDVPLELINTTSGIGRPAIEIWRDKVVTALDLSEGRRG